MDKMREEFEAWYSEFYTPQDASDIWQPIIKSMALKAWQASRQSLVVELPRMPYYDFDVDEIETALDAVGVKYVWVKK